jgi:hypothetical protein
MTNTQKVQAFFDRHGGFSINRDEKIILLLYGRHENIDEIAAILTPDVPWGEIGISTEGRLCYLFVDLINGGHAEICIGTDVYGWLEELGKEEKASDINIRGCYLTEEGYELFENWPTLIIKSKREFKFEQISTQDPSLASVIQISGVDQKEFFPFGSGC